VDRAPPGLICVCADVVNGSLCAVSVSLTTLGEINELVAGPMSMVRR
jgi:hypothetical protein